MTPDRKGMYKPPWSTTDNQGGWVEVTDRCNLACPGCYRKSLEGDKPLDTLKAEIVRCQEVSNCDAMVVAGGEPLLYPQITEVIDFISRRGMKPLILSNGTNFDRLSRELKKAGLRRIHFHVDSRQQRDGWANKNESELNLLRDEFAEQVSKLKTVQCGFHVVVDNENLEKIPEIIDWYRINMHKVNHLSLIAWRGLPEPDGYDYVAANNPVDKQVIEKFYPDQETEISTNDMYDILQRYYPDYAPAAYINGTAFPETNKYLIYVNIGSRNRYYGNFGPKSMELTQIFYHLFTGRYISFALQPAVGLKVFFLSVIDRQVRKAFNKFIRSCIARPNYLLRKIYIQSLILQQPTEFINGERNYCDPCVNPMMYQGKPINPCQLDEYRIFGGILDIVKK